MKTNDLCEIRIQKILSIDVLKTNTLWSLLTA